MNAHQETYRGCDIEISAEGQLTINAKQIDYVFDSKEKKWSTRYLPYSLYSSLLELAKAVVRDTAEFVNASQQ